MLQTLDEWSFDVFALHEASAGAPLKYLGYELLNRYGMIHKFKVRSFPEDLTTRKIAETEIISNQLNREL